MLPSDRSAGLTLQISAPDPMTELFVVNADLQLVDRGVGRLTTKPLPPGIYRVKSRIGEETREQYVALSQPGQTLTLPPFNFASSTVLDNTSKTHEYQMGGAYRESRRVHLTRGKGSAIFVFARDWTGPGSSARPLPSPESAAAGLSLLDSNGRLIADLGTDASVVNELNGDRYSACNIALNPGPYRLAVDLPNGTRLEQSLIACQGWQTQAFLLRRDVDNERRERRPDLTKASILMAASGMGFTPDDVQARRSEIARFALASERSIAQDELRQLLEDKFDNPMFGILGGHLLLLNLAPGEPPGIDLLRRVVSNLRMLVGPSHPDVEALALACGDPTPYQFVLPPMLRRSWAQVVTHTIENPALVPQGSVSADAASHVLEDNPWLVWASRNADDNARARLERNIASALRSAMNPAPVVPPTGALPAAFAAVEKLRLQKAARQDKPSAPRRFDMQSALSTSVNTVGNLVRKFGLPRANVESMLRSTKFDEEDRNGNS